MYKKLYIYTNCSLFVVSAELQSRTYPKTCWFSLFSINRPLSGYFFLSCQNFFSSLKLAVKPLWLNQLIETYFSHFYT